MHSLPDKQGPLLEWTQRAVAKEFHEVFPSQFSLVQNLNHILDIPLTLSESGSEWRALIVVCLFLARTHELGKVMESGQPDRW